MQRAVAETQPVASVQPPFDLYGGSPQPCANFFPHHSPTIPLPADGVVLCHLAGHTHAQNFFQVLFRPQPPMGIAWISCRHRESLLPLGNKARLQKVIGCGDAVDSRQAHLLHQTILQSCKQPLDPPFGLRTVRRNPFDSQFVQRSPELRAGCFSLQLFPDSGAPMGTKDAVFIGVMGQRTSVAP